jgi:hypothetical protein
LGSEEALFGTNRLERLERLPEVISESKDLKVRILLANATL